MMKSFRLPYGKSYMDFSLPRDRLVGILVPAVPDFKGGSQKHIVQEALENPVESPRLRDLSIGKQNVVLIASDHTRPVPSKIITPLTHIAGCPLPKC